MERATRRFLFSPRSTRRRSGFAALAAVSLALSASRVARGDEIVAAKSDAYVSVDNAGRSWTIGNHVVSLVLSADSGDLRIVRFVRADTGRPWALSSEPDTFITVNGQPLPLGRSGGFSVDTPQVSVTRGGVLLNLRLSLPGKLAVARHYAVYPGSPTIETWTTLTGLSGVPIPVSNLNGWQLRMAPGVLHWINGLRSDNADVHNDDAFSLQQRELGVGAPLTLGSHARSSEAAVPWIAVEAAGGDSPAWFYGALLWSGSWELKAEPIGATMRVTLGVPEVFTNIQRDQTLEAPHAIFGVAYGTEINEQAMRGEMARAKALGAEIFVIDAGWYVGAGAGGTYDFTSGLGSWQVDAGRFPSGLGALSDYAHGVGLKFGIWVEPERIAQELIGRVDGLREDWLSTSDGQYQDPHSAQICLGSAPARRWLLSRLFAHVSGSTRCCWRSGTGIPTC
jgi:hypothetical protein